MCKLETNVKRHRTFDDSENCHDTSEITNLGRYIDNGSRARPELDGVYERTENNTTLSRFLWCLLCVGKNKK